MEGSLEKRVSNVAEAGIKFCMDDFATIHQLGTGSYGRVVLVVHKKTHRLFALKTMNKEDIIKRAQVVHVINEKRILSGTSHPNIIKLFGTFNDEANIYLVLEYVQGGDLWYLLRRAGKFNEEYSIFLTANVIVAFQHLHSRNIVYRDLKPENLLLAQNGYLKIADFGLAKEIGSGSHSVCGTPEYIAPEIILNTAYGLEVDWWSLGILIFQLLTGTVPFFDGKSHFCTYMKILSNEVVYPAHLSDTAVDLIAKLLVRDPTKRLGYVNGASEIMSHKWFAGLIFDSITNQTMLPPHN